MYKIREEMNSSKREIEIDKILTLPNPRNRFCGLCVSLSLSLCVFNNKVLVVS